MTTPEGCWYASKDSGNPEEGCLLCPGRRQVNDTKIRVVLARAAAEMCGPNIPYQMEDREASYEKAQENLSRLERQLERERDRVRRAFATCVGPRILDTMVNGLWITAAICTSPDAYGAKTGMQITAHASPLPQPLPDQRSTAEG